MAEIFFEGVKVTVPVEKGVVFNQTKTRDQAIDGLPNRAAV
jgi:hypothetical protein